MIVVTQPHRKHCFIIGNGSLPYDLSDLINKADYVLRFNEPPLFAGGEEWKQNWSGRKTDCLMLCNSGKPMQLKLKSEEFLLSPYFQAAGELVLAYHPAVIRRVFNHPLITSRLFYGRKRDWTREAIENFGSRGKKITILPPQFYFQSCAELDIVDDDLKKKFPSTGYLGIQQALQQCPQNEWQITLAGFSWQGWKRHAWNQEEEWVRAQIATGRLNFIEYSEHVKIL